MKYQHSTIKRSELYKKVWSTPMVKLAKEFGISDVALSKTCERHNIPKPHSGHWSKIEFNKPVKIRELPVSEDGDYEITITALQKPELRTDDSNPVQVAQADELIRQINLDEDDIHISDSMDNTHKLVISAYRSLRNAPENHKQILKHRANRCLPIYVSSDSLNRALFIMDALLSLLEKYNLSIDSKTFKCIDALGYQIPFGLYEKFDRSERQLTKKEKEEKERCSWMHKQPKYVHKPNGFLSLKFDEDYLPSGIRKTWSDGINQNLVDHLRKFILSAIEFSVCNETFKRRNERLSREREEEEKRQKEINKKRSHEKKRVEKLESEMIQWHKSQEIRAYVSYVQKEAIKKGSVVHKDGELDEWVKWATRRADIIDPLVVINPEPWEINLDKSYHYW